VRLAILADNGESLLEYNPEEVKEMLKDLLEEYDFEEAWQIVTNTLKQKTVRL
jgi:protein-arginine kinase activator protein McsA